MLIEKSVVLLEYVEDSFYSSVELKELGEFNTDSEAIAHAEHTDPTKKYAVLPIFEFTTIKKV